MKAYKQEEPASTSVTLRPYQLDAVAAVHQRWNEGDRASLLVMATGCGKTFTASRIVADRADEGRTLWLAHRGELIEQAAETLRERLGLDSNVEKADSIAPREPDLWGAHPVVVGSVPTMRGPRLREWPRNAFATIVVDEAHHAPAKTYREILAHFETAKVLGLTATPDRGDDVALGNVFDSVAYRYDIRTAIRESYLCPITQRAVDVADLDISDVRNVAGDLNQGQLQQALMVDGVLHQVASPLVELAEDRQTLVFTAGVEQAHALADVIAGYVSPNKVKALDGTTAQADRRDMIAQFRDGTVQFLINCAVLTEGFDAPETACIAIARPTKSRSLYAQMIGRGTRIADGKDNCLILDFVGNSGRHKLVTPLDVLAGGPMPEDVRRDALGYIDEGQTTEGALEAAEEQARERERLAAERRRRQAKIQARVGYRAREVDPFAVLGVETCASGPRATEKQLALLKQQGIDLPEESSRKQASKLIDRLIGRRKAGQCTWKQARLLARHGLPTDVSFEDASRAITAMAENGWRCPDWLRAELAEVAA